MRQGSCSVPAGALPHHGRRPPRRERRPPYSISRETGCTWWGKAASPACSPRRSSAPLSATPHSISPEPKVFICSRRTAENWRFVPDTTHWRIKPLCTRSIRQARGRPRPYVRTWPCFYAIGAIGRPFVLGWMAPCTISNKTGKRSGPTCTPMKRERVVWWRKMSYPFT